MIKKLQFVYLFVALSALSQPVAMACNEAVETRLSKVSDAVVELVGTTYTDLKPFQIRVRANHSRETFFRSGFTVESIFKKPLQREYEIVMSDRYCLEELSHEALQGVLAHELWHIRDYVSMSGAELMRFVLKYGLAPRRYVPQYEKHTDMRALESGYGVGLRAFRVWQYQTMPSKIVAKKKRNYLTVDQITEWLSQHPDN